MLLILLKITWNKSRDWAAGMILSSKNERISWNLSLWILDCNDPYRFEFNSAAIGFADMFYLKNLNIFLLDSSQCVTNLREVSVVSFTYQGEFSKYVLRHLVQWCHQWRWLKSGRACSFCRVGSGCFSLHLSGGLDPSAIGNIFHYLLWTTRKRMEDSIIGIKIHGGAMEEPDLSLKDLQPHNFIDSSRSWPQGKLWMLGMLPGDVDEWIYSTLHYSAWIFGTSISHLTLKQQISPTDVRCEIPVLDKNSSVGWIW